MKTIKTDGSSPLLWKWLLRVTYADRFDVVYGSAHCPAGAVQCASAALETFSDDDEKHELAVVHMWNPTTKQCGAAPLIPNPGLDAPTV